MSTENFSVNAVYPKEKNTVTINPTKIFNYKNLKKKYNKAHKKVSDEIKKFKEDLNKYTSKPNNNHTKNSGIKYYKSQIEYLKLKQKNLEEKSKKGNINNLKIAIEDVLNPTGSKLINILSSKVNNPLFKTRVKTHPKEEPKKEEDIILKTQPKKKKSIFGSLYNSIIGSPKPSSPENIEEVENIYKIIENKDFKRFKELELKKNLTKDEKTEFNNLKEKIENSGKIYKIY